MQHTETRILYRNLETGETLPFPLNFQGTLDPFWRRIPGQVTGNWRKPGPVPVEVEE